MPPAGCFELGPKQSCYSNEGSGVNDRMTSKSFTEIAIYDQSASAFQLV